eukprot:m.83007 g.83007  ORF g.83007 m.83007 type:complete len:1185 (+) comp8681_c2_seq1:261-3815(+)
MTSIFIQGNFLLHATCVVALLFSVVSPIADAALPYANAPFLCTYDQCHLATQSCLDQVDCNGILSCRDACYSTHANDKLSEVACLEGCQSSSNSNGLTLFSQYMNCYMMLCPDVYHSELCSGYNTQPLCEDQEGCTFLESETEMCQYGDFTPPEFVVCEVDIVKSARENGPSQTVSWRVIEANDANIVTLTQTKGLSRGSDFPIGTTDIQYKAEDESGNVNYCNFTVTIVDDTPPVFESCPQSRIIRSTRNDIVVDNMHVPRVRVTWVLPVISDNVGATLVDPSPASNTGLFIAGSHTIIYTAADDEGNEATCEFDITIVPAPTTYFTINREKSVSNPTILLSFPLGVSTDACADRCLSHDQCQGFIADREGVGRCLLFSGYDSFITDVSTNTHIQQQYSVFECLYDDILACPYTTVATSTNCTEDIAAYQSCVTPLLASCRDSDLVASIATTISTDMVDCEGSAVMETFNNTGPYQCAPLVASLSTCFGCCQDSYNDALDLCSGLITRYDECAADRYSAFDVCSGVCIDARTTSTPQPPTPSSFVDLAIPLELLGVGYNDNDNILRARIIASVASVFELNEDELHLNITQTTISSIVAELSIRLADTYTPPDTAQLSSSPARRRRTAADAAKLVTFFRSATNVDLLIGRLNTLFLSSLSNFLSVSTSGIVTDVASDAANLVTTTAGPTVSSSSGPTLDTTTIAATGTTQQQTTIPPPSGPNASGTTNNSADTVPVIAIAVLGAVIFVVIVIILIRAVSRKKHHKHKRLPTTHPATKRNSVRGGTFGNNRVLPNIIGNKDQQKVVTPRPQPPEKLPAMSRPAVQDPFSREPGSARRKSVNFTEPNNLGRTMTNFKPQQEGDRADVMTIPDSTDKDNNNDKSSSVANERATTATTTTSSSSSSSTHRSPNHSPSQQRTASKPQQTSSQPNTPPRIDDDDDDDEKDNGDNGIEANDPIQHDEGEDVDVQNGEGLMVLEEDEGSVTKKKQKLPKYANQLMVGEVMESIPDDITDNWSCVVCPKGRRCLIVSHNGYTQAFNRFGKPLFKFNSLLPGGGRTPSNYRGSCVVDGIFNEETSTFYILDIIYWHGMHILDSPFDFRSFWLESKWMEMPDITEPSAVNKYAMIALPRLPCDNAQIHEYISNIPDQRSIDGLSLFFNNGVYEPGENPLVLWVGADKIEEVLAVE